MNSSKLSDNHIPKGRGMVKWLPMSTIPEQYERISKILDEQDMIDPPIHDNETRINLEEKLKYSINKRVVLRYWSHGYEVQLDCIIYYIEIETQLIIVKKDNEFLNISFKYIYDLI